MEVFWEKGLDGASMNDLTAAMGINSPSLYAAFDSQEALFRDDVALYVATDGAGIWAPLKEEGSAYGVVEGFLMATARIFTRPDRPSGRLAVISPPTPSTDRQAISAELSAKREHKHNR